MTVFNRIRAAVQKRADYVRIKHALESMPTETAIDLGLFREDAGKTAAKVVYG